MAAIMGLDPAALAALCAEAAAGEVLGPANFNAPGQIVIAGHAGAVERARALAGGRGAKVVPLKVSAPFHCALMNPAGERLRPELRAVRAHDPRIPVVANVDAQPRRTAAASIDALIAQVSSPVRWEDTVKFLATAGVTTYVEVGPGTVLSGLIRKIHRDATVFNVLAPEDLNAVPLTT
jgi:[acyl-carrier-protein] S-malonyltransferase